MSTGCPQTEFGLSAPVAPLQPRPATTGNTDLLTLQPRLLATFEKDVTLIGTCCEPPPHRFVQAEDGVNADDAKDSNFSNDNSLQCPTITISDETEVFVDVSDQQETVVQQDVISKQTEANAQTDFVISNGDDSPTIADSQEDIGQEENSDGDIAMNENVENVTVHCSGDSEIGNEIRLPVELTSSTDGTADKENASESLDNSTLTF